MMVYMIQQGKNGPIKVGKAGNVDARLAQLQTGNPTKLYIVAVLPCNSHKHALQIEKMFHIRFSRLRLHGEWFRPKILNKLRKLSGEDMGSSIPDWMLEEEDQIMSHMQSI